MSFGKRGKGEGHPARDLLPPVEDVAPISVRTTVANPGGIDKGFIALAVGVVLVSGGAAIAAPAVIDMFGGQVRPIEQIVAGLDRQQAKIALARDVLPDAEGRAFLSSLQQNFPAEHDKLMTVLADEALGGGNRDDLLEEFGKWSIEFAAPNMAAVSRTGAEGFDEILDIADGALTLVDSTAGCTPQKLQAFIEKPENLEKSWAYGSDGYKFSMRTSTTLVNLAARGRNAPPAPTNMRPEDEQAFLTLAMGMMGDPQVMELMKASSSAPSARGAASMPDINICKLGKSVTYKLRRMPHGTKERVFGLAAQGFTQAQTRALQDMMSGKGAASMPLNIFSGSPAALGQMEHMQRQ